MSRERGTADTCCFFFGLRLGTIIITVFLLINYLSIPCRYDGKSEVIIHTQHNDTKIDVSPQRMDYVFAVFLPVVISAMLLSAILKKSEILFYAMITFIIAYILLTVYSTLGEERGWWFEHKFPPTRIMITYDKANATSKYIRASGAVFVYVIQGYFMFVVYSYVEKLRQDNPTSEKHSPLIF